MALANNFKNNHNKQLIENYEELKKFISSLDENKKINNFWLAHEHIINMENKRTTRTDKRI